MIHPATPLKLAPDDLNGLISEPSQMKKPHPPKPKLTDAERHRRFVETAKKVGASEDLKEFDRAFETVVSVPSRRLHKAKGSNVRK